MSPLFIRQFICLGESVFIDFLPLINFHHSMSSLLCLRCVAVGPSSLGTSGTGPAVSLKSATIEESLITDAQLI